MLGVAANIFPVLFDLLDDWKVNSAVRQKTCGPIN